MNYVKKKTNHRRGENHYTKFPEKKKEALEKRKISRDKNRENIYNAYCKKKQQYDKKLEEHIRQIEPYDVEYTISKLENEIYLKYLGKSKNYTMIKEDSKLYKSVMVHTEQYLKYYGNKYLPFSCRVQLIGKFKLNVPREYYCRCGLKLKFDRATQKFTYKGFCKKCMLTPTEEEFYKYKFPEEWEYKFNIHKEKMSKTARELYLNTGNNSSINIGRNETCILNYIEDIFNIVIDRNFNIVGYKPDGYCHETITIYEVYEPFHLKENHIQKDKKRMKIIMNNLKCKFFIIYDKNPKKTPDFENLKIEIYEQY